MTDLIPTKPYMIRAIHDWCVDSGLTPHLIVAVNNKTRVPIAYVKDGEIVLNLNYAATKDLNIGNDAIVFSARFGGISQHLYVPIDAVRGIFARENGQGMFFEITPPTKDESLDAIAPPEGNDKPISAKDKKRPSLTIVK